MTPVPDSPWFHLLNVGGTLLISIAVIWLVIRIIKKD